MPRNYRSVSGRSWLDIRTNGAKFNTELKKMQTSITAAPNEIYKGYFIQMQKLAWEAARVGRDKIANDTNTKKYQRTGEKGRIDTGKMINSFWANARKEGADRYKINLGYLSGKPGYSIFQEYGTRNGLRGVEALRTARDYFQQEARGLGAGGRIYVERVGWDWKAKGYGGTDLGGPPSWFKG